MKRFTAPLAIIILSGGCHAPMPTFDLLAPYGTPRVPPPATGSFGAPDSYYQGQPRSSGGSTTSPAVGTGVRARDGNDSSWADKGSNRGTNGESDQRLGGRIAGATAAGAVEPANFESPAGRATSRSVLVDSNRIRIVDEPTGRQAPRTRLRGMPINDATRSSEPARFRTPTDAIEISELPRIPPGAGKAEARIGGIPVEAETTGTAYRDWQPRATRNNLRGG